MTQEREEGSTHCLNSLDNGLQPSYYALCDFTLSYLMWCILPVHLWYLSSDAERTRKSKPLDQLPLNISRFMLPF